MMNKELILGEDYKKAIGDAANIVLDTVGSTLGPNGKTVILMDEKGEPYTTKDGVSVINNLSVSDPFVNSIISLIRHAAAKSAEEAGDGTTTASVIASTILQLALKHNINPKDLHEEFKSVEKDIYQSIKKASIYIGAQDVYNTALVSANGDKGIAETVQMAFNHSEIVKVEKGDGLKDTIDFIEGIKYPVTYHSKTFITNQDTREAIMDDCDILVIDGKLKDLKCLKSILTACRDNQSKLVIVVEEVMEEPLQLLRQMHVNETIDVVLVKSPGYASYRKEYLKDMADFSGGKVVDNLLRDVSVDKLGKLAKIIVNSTETYMQPVDDAVTDGIVNSLLTFSKQPNLSEYDREIIQDRIQNLNGSMTVIYAGGKSSIDMRERHDRIEDAIFACSSALDEGTVPGGGDTLFDIATELVESNNSLPMQIIAAALCSPKVSIRKSGYNKDTPNEVVDPAKVTRCAVANAFSVALLILGGSSIILKPEQWK